MDFYLRWYNRGTVNPDNPYINMNCTLNNNKSSTGHIINTIKQNIYLTTAASTGITVIS